MFLTGKKLLEFIFDLPEKKEIFTGRFIHSLIKLGEIIIFKNKYKITYSYVLLQVFW